MVNLLRRFQQPLMIGVTILIIIAFVWLYNSTSPRLDQMGSTEIGSIYGESVSQTEFIRAARKFEIARDLNQFDLLQSLAGAAQTMDEAAENFVWHNIILNHEAEKLGIRPTEAEVEQLVREMPAFQSNGAFDSTRYVNFVQNALSPRGFTEEQLFEIVRDILRLREIKEVLGATTATSPSEIRAVYELRNQKTELSLVRLKLADFLAKVTVSEEDLKKAYEEQKASLNTEEKRKVKYAAFTLNEEQKKLTGKPRVEAMQTLADKAQEFAIALTEAGANFDELAKKFEATVAVSPEFAAMDAPTELGSAPAVVQSAFRLTKEQPHSDALSGEDGYYVLELAEILPTRPLTFEEAKAQIEEQLKNQRAQEAMSLRGTEIRNKIAEAMKSGQSFAEAAQAAGATVEKFPAYSLAQPNFDQPGANEIIGRAADLKAGETSEFVQTSDGGVIIHVDNRLPIDETAFEKEKQMISQSLARNRREALFQEWLKGRRAEANLELARG